MRRTCRPANPLGHKESGGVAYGLQGRLAHMRLTREGKPPVAHEMLGGGGHIDLPQGKAPGLQRGGAAIGLPEAGRAPVTENVTQLQAGAGHIGQRVAQGRVFPVEHGGDAAVLPDQVFGPKIPMEQNGRAGEARVFHPRQMGPQGPPFFLRGQIIERFGQRIRP